MEPIGETREMMMQAMIKDLAGGNLEEALLQALIEEVEVVDTQEVDTKIENNKVTHGEIKAEEAIAADLRGLGVTITIITRTKKNKNQTKIGEDQVMMEAITKREASKPKEDNKSIDRM